MSDTYGIPIVLVFGPLAGLTWSEFVCVVVPGTWLSERRSATGKIATDAFHWLRNEIGKSAGGCCEPKSVIPRVLLFETTVDRVGAAGRSIAPVRRSDTSVRLLALVMSLPWRAQEACDHLDKEGWLVMEYVVGGLVNHLHFTGAQLASSIGHGSIDSIVCPEEIQQLGGGIT